MADEMVQTGNEEVGEDALLSFTSDYGERSHKPVLVLMAAFNEAESVAEVIKGIPAVIAGLETETIVIDDGSSDGTAAIARQAGALVLTLATNLGQGKAFRLGYRLAISRGAQYIATIDADGQFDPGELARVLSPLIEGKADFVNGSRRLGLSETTDSVRKAGLVVFGGVITVLTRVRITDPANGLRAFTTKVIEGVPLRQAQYQTSELLIGAIAHGFRVIEVPVTVYVRHAGKTKKGGNLVYGYRFSRVVIGTWWRERRA